MFEEQIASARNAGFSDDEILNHIKQGKPDIAPKIDTALSERFSATEILNHLSPPKAGLGGNLFGGLAQTGADIVKTGEALGLVDKSTSKATDQFAKDIYGGKSGSERFYGGEKTLGSTAGALAEGAAPMAMDVAAGLTGARLGAAAGGAVGSAFAGVGAVPGAALGGLVGGLGGYFGSDLLRNYGRRLEARQEANNGAEPTATDKALAVAASAPQAVLNRFAVGKALKPAANVAERGAAQAVGRTLEAAGAGAASNAAGDVVEQVARNIGTEKGDTSIGQTVDSALLGAAGGGTVRGTAEVAGAGRNAVNKRALKDFEFKEDAADLGNLVSKTAQDNGLNINKLDDAGRVLEIVRDETKAARQEANRYSQEAIQLAQRLGVEQDVITRARAALKDNEPARSHVEALQKVVDAASEANPSKVEGFQALVDSAKRAANVKQLLRQSNFETPKNASPTVSGGLSGWADRKTKGLAKWIAATTGVTSGILGAGSYIGYAGLPALAKAGAVIGNAAPIGTAIAGAYGGARLLDKALNLRNPVKRFADATDAGQSAPRTLGGGEGVAGMEQRLAQTKEAEMLAKQALAQQTIRDRAEARTQRGVQDLMAQRAGAYAFDEQGLLDKMQGNARAEEAALMRDFMKSPRGGVKPDAAYPGQRFVAEGIDPPPPPPPPPNEGKMAKGAMDLAKAVQKLDILTGNVKDPSHYEGITQLRMPVEDLKAIQDRVKSDLEVAKLKDTAAKALAKAAKVEAPKEPKAPKEAPKAPEAPPKAPEAPKPVEPVAPKAETPKAEKPKQAEPKNTDEPKKRKGGTKKPPEVVTDKDGNEHFKNPMEAFRHATDDAMKRAMERAKGAENEGILSDEAYQTGSKRRTNTKVQAANAAKGLLKEMNAPEKLIKAMDGFVQLETKEQARKWIVRRGREAPDFADFVKKHFDHKPDEKMYSHIERTMK